MLIQLTLFGNQREDDQALRLIYVSHNFDNIAKCILVVDDEYGLTDTIFFITIENACSSTKFMEILTPALSSDVGS